LDPWPLLLLLLLLLLLAVRETQHGLLEGCDHCQLRQEQQQQQQSLQGGGMLGVWAAL
jgi:hypothetical protein